MLALAFSMHAASRDSSDAAGGEGAALRIPAKIDPRNAHRRVADVMHFKTARDELVELAKPQA